MVFGAMAMCLGPHTAATPQSSSSDPRIAALLQRAYTAHGGPALKTLQTLQETSEMTGTAPFGIRVPSQVTVISLDRTNGSGRWQVNKDGKIYGVYQQTREGLTFWAQNNQPQKISAERESTFVPLMRTGVVGLLALKDTKDNLTFVEQGEIKGKKGPMIVRTQFTPQETILLLGKGELVRESARTTWCYLFGPDGMLIAEKIVQQQPKRIIEAQMSYDRFETFGGIKFPTLASIKYNQVPKMVALKVTVKQIQVNEPLPKMAFSLP